MFNWIDSAWHRATGAIDSTIANWVHALVRGLYSFLHVIFGDVGRAWDNYWREVHGFIAGARLFADKVIGALKDAFDWINKEGYLVYYYISHPIKLVDLVYDALLGKIESTAVDTAERLGKFFLAFILKNLKTFITVLEDIVNAVL